MKILVTVREVSELEDELEMSGLDIDERYLEYDLNEWGDYAVEEAVQISEETDDVEVVTVTIGPERSEEIIRIHSRLIHRDMRGAPRPRGTVSATAHGVPPAGWW